MTTERICLILALSLLTACKFYRAEVASDAQTQMVGMSKEAVLACMGAPAQIGQAGDTEVWSYSSGGDATTVSSTTLQRYCIVNVLMADDRVRSISYSGRTGGLLTEGEQCAFAVENCVQ